MKKSRIQELFLDPQSVFVFDVDGVLAPLEYGVFNHYELDDDAWGESLKNGKNPYMSVSPFEVMQKFIQTLNIDRVYVITKVMNELELEYKKEFLKFNYGILESHVFSVYDDDHKVQVLNFIYQKYPSLPFKNLIMIEDSVEVLNHIMVKTKFSTVHISSFLK